MSPHCSCDSRDCQDLPWRRAASARDAGGDRSVMDGQPRQWSVCVKWMTTEFPASAIIMKLAACMEATRIRTIVDRKGIESRSRFSGKRRPWRASTPMCGSQFTAASPQVVGTSCGLRGRVDSRERSRPRRKAGFRVAVTNRNGENRRTS